MNRADSSKTGNQPCGDAELAELEREMETGGSTSKYDALSSLRREHLDAYAIVDGLSPFPLLGYRGGRRAAETARLRRTDRDRSRRHGSRLLRVA